MTRAASGRPAGNSCRNGWIAMSPGSSAMPETELTKKELEHFAKILAERKERLGEEIRRVLARSENERYADILAGGGDAGDTSVADLLSDVTFAEVARDAAEVRDINAAQARIAAGTYGVCIDCGRPIGKKRLEA